MMKRIAPKTVAVVAALWFGLLPALAPAVELDRRQRAMVNTIAATISRAGKAYFEGQYEASAEEIRKALNQVEVAVDQGSPELYDAINGHLDKISRAHALLELEGVSLPPFRRPQRPTAPPTEDPEPSAPMTEGVSFSQDVAPILAQRCGQCHVRGSRGGFSLASYAALMKGPPEGVVVFAGDVIGSRLIETIETGDMPRGGGRVSPDELKTLKDWIAQGAKFDGSDPNQSIAASAPSTPAMPATPAPKVNRATGNETVRFSVDIAPLLVDNCSGCHIDAMQNRGGLRMDTFAQLLRGGDSGPMITPGRGEASLLVRKLRGTATDGARMPAGGRPPLADDAIALISKWIDEGAAIDADEDQPITVISKLAWAAQASSEELSQRRAELANRNFSLAFASAQPVEHTTDHFRLLGSGSADTLELVGRYAENHLKVAKTITRTGSTDAEDFFRGRATIFVLPRRYDYSEFAKMVEQRSVPSDWFAHWKFDGVDAYLAVVATERESEEEIETRLLAPVVSLAVATRGGDVPRWFAEGLGVATSMQQNAKSRQDKEKLAAEAAQAASSVKDAKAFLNNRLTPEQADSFGAALAMSMLDRGRRKSLDGTLRALVEGKPFEQAFMTGFGVPPEVYIDQFLNFAR